MNSRLNHFFSDLPPFVGSIAVCGYVKKCNRGFDSKAGTCNKCVEIVLGSKVRKIKSSEVKR